jgi:hypothetical protein
MLHHRGSARAGGGPPRPICAAWGGRTPSPSLDGQPGSSTSVDPSGQPQMHTRLPARSERVQCAGAWDSSTMRPPAAIALSGEEPPPALLAHDRPPVARGRTDSVDAASITVGIGWRRLSDGTTVPSDLHGRVSAPRPRPTASRPGSIATSPTPRPSRGTPPPRTATPSRPSPRPRRRGDPRVHRPTRSGVPRGTPPRRGHACA